MRLYRLKSKLGIRDLGFGRFGIRGLQLRVYGWDLRLSGLGLGFRA